MQHVFISFLYFLSQRSYELQLRQYAANSKKINAGIFFARRHVSGTDLIQCSSVPGVSCQRVSSH